MAYSPRVRVVWDEAKNLANQRKHGLSFEDAREMFVSGVEYLEIFDEAHSANEDRFLGIGPGRGGLVFVVYTERDDDVIRIISARIATTHERKLYRAYMQGLP